MTMFVQIRSALTNELVARVNAETCRACGDAIVLGALDGEGRCGSCAPSRATCGPQSVDANGREVQP